MPGGVRFPPHRRTWFRSTGHFVERSELLLSSWYAAAAGRTCPRPAAAPFANYDPLQPDCRLSMAQDQEAAFHPDVVEHRTKPGRVGGA